MIFKLLILSQNFDLLLNSYILLSSLDKKCFDVFNSSIFFKSDKYLSTFCSKDVPKFIKEGWIDSIDFRNSLITVRKSKVATHSAESIFIILAYLKTYLVRCDLLFDNEMGLHFFYGIYERVGWTLWNRRNVAKNSIVSNSRNIALRIIGTPFANNDHDV